MNDANRFLTISMFNITKFSDSSPPQITFSGDLPETTSRNPTLTWSSNEFAKFECKLEDGIIFDCRSGEDSSWTGRNLTDGPHSLSVRGTDNLGNKGQFISRSWNVGKLSFWYFKLYNEVTKRKSKSL